MKLDKSKIEKILVINFGIAEEVLQSTPVAENLRHNFPNAVIIFLIQKKSIAALNNNPFLTRVLTFDFETDSSKCLKKNIRMQKYDLVIDLSGDSLSAAVISSSRALYKASSLKELGLEIISNEPKVYKINISDL